MVAEASSGWSYNDGQNGTYVFVRLKHLKKKICNR